MGYRRDLTIACKDKGRVIDKLNIRLDQLQQDNDELQRNIQQERATAAAEMEVALCRKDSILMEKEKADKKLVEIEKVICELQEENLSQTKQIHRLEQDVQVQRKTIWGVVSSLFVVAAASLVYGVLSRR